MNPSKKIQNLIELALKEDIGGRDLTTELTVSENSTCTATLTAKQDGVLSGIEVYRCVFDHMDAQMTDWQSMEDSETIVSGDIVASFNGLTRATLTGERTALNFLQHLSGIATETSKYVAAVHENPVRICDTRKTTPMLRDLEKVAVRHGGGWNHRQALYDGILIKENHIQAAGSITEAVQLAHDGSHHLLNIEVEVTDLAECQEALDAGAGVIMLDNMSLDDMRQAVELGRGHSVSFEASGNVNLNTVADIAATGIDIVSVGSITHSAPSVDFSLTIGIH